jgi:ubiquilin
MLQSPEFRRQMMDPNFIRQMNQMQRMMGGGPAQPAAFPAPGPATNADAVQGVSNAASGSAPAPDQPGLPDLSQMMQMLRDNNSPAADRVGGNASGAAGPGPDFFSQLMQNPALMNMFGGPGATGMPFADAPADNRPPEERYSEQLRQLNDMGFFDFDSNVTALRRSGGSVQGAIEALLSGSL